MAKFKDFMAIVCLILCQAGAIALIVIVWNKPAPDPMVTNLLNILLFILSSLGAIIIGYYFTRIGSSEKVNTIAEQSTEKMVHLSLQLQHLKDYLSETVEVADDESSVHPAAGTHAYRHRVEAAADMAASLASSNEAFRSDWLGVVSAPARKTIEDKYAKLRGYLQDADTLERLRSQRDSGVASESGQTEVATALREVEKRIENARRELPIQPQPRLLLRPPAVSVEQTIKTEASATSQKGILTINLLRPVFAATGSGRLTPQTNGPPRLSAKLLSSPHGLDTKNFRVSPGSGTNFDFHIGLKSTAYGVYLPVGVYEVEYEAECIPIPDFD